MPETYENRDMAGAIFRNVDLRGASFEDVNLAEATIRNASLANVTIENANIAGLTIFGIRVDRLIDAELDRRDPERVPPAYSPHSLPPVRCSMIQSQSYSTPRPGPSGTETHPSSSMACRPSS